MERGHLFREREPCRGQIPAEPSVKFDNLDTTRFRQRTKTFFVGQIRLGYNVSQSGDGKQIAVVRGKLITDVVMLSKITQTK